MPLLGVFALDSPTRPNPIGLTLVRLLGQQGRLLKVSGLDFFDGTPIPNIKGYRPTIALTNSAFPIGTKICKMPAVMFNLIVIGVTGACGRFVDCLERVGR